MPNFSWSDLPLEVVHYIEATMGETHSVRGLIKMRLLCSSFASKYRNHAYCLSADTKTMVLAILAIGKDLLDRPNYSRRSPSGGSIVRMTTVLYSFLYTAVYHRCTRGDRVVMCAVLSDPNAIQSFSQGMNEEKKELFKKFLISVFRYLNRSCNGNSGRYRIDLTEAIKV